MTLYNRKIPVSFACYSGMYLYLFLELMIRNKNDCILAWSKLKELRGSVAGIETYKYFGFEKYSLNLKELRNEKTKEVLLNKYKECKKNKKLFCMPTYKVGHANMIIFNTFRNEIEYYEPHGTGTKTFEDAVKNIVKYFKKNGVDVAYSPSADSCPKIDKKTAEKWEEMNIVLRENWGQYKDKKVKQLGGLQAYDGTKAQRKEKVNVKGKMISDPGGFCCMWSFLQMDFRLRNPMVDPDALANKLVSKIKGNPEQFFREYIRGYTFDIVKRLADHLGEKDYDLMVNINTKKNHTEQNISRLNIKIAEIVTKMYKEAGGQSTSTGDKKKEPEPKKPEPKKK